MVRPVFYDPSGRRRRLSRLGILAAIVAVFLCCVIFATTVLDVPAASPLPIGYERLSALPFRTQVSRIKHRIVHFLPLRRRSPAPGTPLTVAFYTPWSQDGAPSLARNINRIDWLAPVLYTMKPDGSLQFNDDGKMRRIVQANLHRPLILPVVQNASNGDWNGKSAAALMHDPRRRAALVASLSAQLGKSRDAGVVFDFEELPEGSLHDLVKLVAETHRAFAPRHRLVAVTVPVDDPTWPLASLALASDRVIIMAYDEHYQNGPAGPVASNAWFAEHVADSLRRVPLTKAVIALGNYGYDWGGGQTDPLTIEEAWLEARDSETVPQWDRASGNVGFSYSNGDDASAPDHNVWMIDATSSWNELRILSRFNVNSVALWRLGSEDPGYWPVLGAWRDHRPLPDLTKIQQSTNVDVEGQGEILRIAATPQPGTRTVEANRRTGEITGETYTSLPTPYVVQRVGARPKLVALTFDDGPDPVWTPKILSVLEKYHVPATFFVIGENGVANRSLLQRIVADGDEIGNHSYTHPNMAGASATSVGIELNTTQRLVEAYTGRSTHLFRAPYFGDAEPTTADELVPAQYAQDHGYTIVGLHADSEDWTRPGVPTIVANTVSAVEGATPGRSANIVLMHDGGGDRSQTVAALPQVIERLEAQGYRFVPVSTLAGLSGDQAMPRITGVDLAAVRVDVFFFVALGGLLSALKWTFFFAIALGIVRALALTGLALLPRRIAPAGPPPGEEPLVTVIIPAYNEEKVIEASVRRILDSDWSRLEVIVADDGSRDRTSEIVTTAFGNEPRVRLMTMVNGGKASALNRALAVAGGEIVVALDADTQFERETIRKLVRWFSDERIGAVAGNARVGNRVNIVTRWQAVEYVTAQNIERRALGPLDAIMVVPGAVGAWRRAALEEVGGYPEDTLAEDQDLTIAVQRKGWKVAYDQDAVAWTEAPETLRALSKQRFRWAYGTLQCLWKHRGVLARRKPGGLAFIGMPQAWLFQVLFAVISPLIDLALVVSIVETVMRVAQHGWAQTQTDVLRMGAYWLAFTAIDLLCGLVAWRLDVRDKRFPALRLLSQRFVYRQLMYGVVIRAVGSAIAGLGIGWGKLERTGRVEAATLGPGGSAQRKPEHSDETRLPVNAA
ncbi:MAG: glycosyltransferase [Sphingomonadales bacterium]|nr:glycosyltransferase [Sphingomonadales bacterium]MDE2568103.1 glycosyltransferase [Sphingomonadales bacterium]